LNRTHSRTKKNTKYKSIVKMNKTPSNAQISQLATIEYQRTVYASTFEVNVWNSWK